MNPAAVPVYNPPVPYRGSLPILPQHGSSVIINGVVPVWSNRFHINLETDRGDVALHFNPRFEGTNQVIRNSCCYGVWGSEERNGYFPFSPGALFEVMILIEDNQYKIAVNRQHHCEFVHRIPKENVKRLTVEGDVQLTQILFQAGFQYPSPPPVIHNPPLPVNSFIAGGLSPGKMIKVSGQVKKNANRFNVNLVSGSGFNSNADIALHYDVRLNYGDSHNIQVRNTRCNGSWGSEERHASHFPFIRGAPFDIIIRVEHDKYKIAVNNQHMFDYHHRLLPVTRFDHLAIEGDISISSIQFQ